MCCAHNSVSASLHHEHPTGRSPRRGSSSCVSAQLTHAMCPCGEMGEIYEIGERGSSEGMLPLSKSISRSFSWSGGFLTLASVGMRPGPSSVSPRSSRCLQLGSGCTPYSVGLQPCVLLSGSGSCSLGVFVSPRTGRLRFLRTRVSFVVSTNGHWYIRGGGLNSGTSL